jgi:hypothetical protein
MLIPSQRFSSFCVRSVSRAEPEQSSADDRYDRGQMPTSGVPSRGLESFPGRARDLP